MNNGLMRLIVVGGLIAVAAFTLTASVSFGDDAESAESEQATVTTDSAAAAAALDSVYGLINTSFAAIKPTVAAACFDCHSDKTDYPWYHSLPLIGGWMEGHVNEGRGELDMTSGFPFQTHMPPANSLLKIKHEIEEGEMPIWSYRLMHSSARLSDEQKDSIYTWVDESLKLLETQGIKPMRRGRRGAEAENEEH